MITSFLHFLRNYHTLTKSQKNIPLISISAALSMFLLYTPVRILWMQEVMTNSQISFLIGWFFLSIVFLELPTGALADLIGKRNTVLTGYILESISLLLYAISNSFMAFALAISVHALGEALISGARDALLYDTLAEEGRIADYRPVFSNIMVLCQFSLVAATYIGGALGTIHLSIPFYLNAVVLVAAAVLMLGIQEPAVDTLTFTLKNYVKQTVDGTVHLFRTRKLVKLSLLYMLVGGIGWTFQRLMRDVVLISVGFRQLELGLISGTLRLLNILFLARVVQSTLFRKSHRDLLLLPFVLVIALLPGQFINSWTSIPIIAGAMMVGTGRFIILGPYLQDEISSEYRATAISVANLMVSLLLATSLFLASFALDQLPIPTVVALYGLFSLVFIVPLAISVKSDYRTGQ